MNRPETLGPAGQSYLAGVDEHLLDLDPADRADLRAQVEDRLVDLQPEQDATAVLGAPTLFATELRRAAGFGPATPPVRQENVSLSQWLVAQAQRSAPLAVIDYVRSLRPAWWALRGFLLVALVLAVLSSGGGWGLHTIGSYIQVVEVRAEHAGRWPAGVSPWLLLVLAAVVASVVMGRCASRLPHPVRLVMTALDVLAAFTLLAYPTWWMGPAFAYFTALAG